MRRPKNVNEIISNTASVRVIAASQSAGTKECECEMMSNKENKLRDF
jgi:hypothetical protein